MISTRTLRCANTHARLMDTVVLPLFVSSRIRHTSWNCDWSSDVCSSDLYHRVLEEIERPLLSIALGATRGNQIRAAEQIGRASCRERVNRSESAVAIK